MLLRDRLYSEFDYKIGSKIHFDYKDNKYEDIIYIKNIDLETKQIWFSDGQFTYINWFEERLKKNEHKILEY